MARKDTTGTEAAFQEFCRDPAVVEALSKIRDIDVAFDLLRYAFVSGMAHGAKLAEKAVFK